MNDALNRGIRTFHQLIRRSWADVAACASAGTYDGQVSDWLQGNWDDWGLGIISIPVRFRLLSESTYRLLHERFTPLRARRRRGQGKGPLRMYLLRQRVSVT